VVRNKAVQLAENFDSEIDLDLIKTGSQLHDIGRSRTHGLDHAVEGAKILRELGFAEDVINIVERHIGAGITSHEAKMIGLPDKDYTPQTLEEKIVAHADNLISGDREISLDMVIQKWNLETGHPSVKRLYKLHYEVTGELFDK
jgi:uncharacterized protein